MNKLNTIDLFAGCGGLTDGFEQTGFYNTLACVEWEKKPCETLVQRLHDKWHIKDAQQRVIRFDIQRIDELFNGWRNDRDFGTHKGLSALVGNQEVDLIVGGPPCQAYSIAGRIRDENGMNDDYRNFLFESYLEVVKKVKPKAFVFENVEGLLSANPGGISIVERITKQFSSIGFEISADLKKYALLDCSKFGVPQVRKRLIILGINREYITENPQVALFEFYKIMLRKFIVAEPTTVRQAIGDLPKMYPLNNQIKVNNKKISHDYTQSLHVLNNLPRAHSKRDIEVFKLLTEDIESGRNEYVKTDALKELYTKITGKLSNIHKYHVLRLDKPSNTIPAHLYKDGLRHIHPDSKQSRTITVREAARLQTFDDDFEFLGSQQDQYKMIGNAVPPKFANIVAMATKEFFDKYYASILYKKTGISRVGESEKGRQTVAG
jgi:DNA (cytosine-5)-methyltransferase 1